MIRGQKSLSFNDATVRGDQGPEVDTTSPSQHPPSSNLNPSKTLRPSHASAFTPIQLLFFLSLDEAGRRLKTSSARANIDEKKKIRKSLEIDEKEERWKESGLIDRDGENGYSVEYVLTRIEILL